MTIDVRALVLALVLALPSSARAQGPSTVFFEDLTSNEIHNLIRGGYRSVILATGGTEDNGAHMALGKHNYIVAYAAERIARALGKTLVAPVIAYVPEGSWTPPTDHMQRPGTMSLPDADGYRDLLEAAAVSLHDGGFENVILIGDSGGNQSGLQAVADELNGRWHTTGGRALFVSDYYAKAMADQNRYVAEALHMTPGEIGTHANIVDTSELMFVKPEMVREERIDLAADSTGSIGDPRRATREIGARLMEIKIDDAVAQIREAIPSASDAPLGTSFMSDEIFPSRTALLLEELTWMEVRDAVAGGSAVAIVSTGGTEKNGFHMATGKHNFLIREGALEMARKLGKALIAPVIPYVPEAPATPEDPGVLSCGDGCFEAVVTAAVRSLKAAGFKDILLIGDNGGNQAGLRAVAERLGREWAGTGVRVFALTDYYDRGHEQLDRYLLAKYGWDAQTVGSHAGIADTSQLLYVKPQDVRTDQLAHSETDRQASGVSGDPTKATPDIGLTALHFKVDAGIAQYRALKAAAPGTVGR